MGNDGYIFACVCPGIDVVVARQSSVLMGGGRVEFEEGDTATGFSQRRGTLSDLCVVKQVSRITR